MNVDEFKILKAESDEHFKVAANLFHEYLKDLGVDLSFQKFHEELSNLDKFYSKKNGFLVLIQNVDGAYIACAGVRKLTEERCEFKRLYVIPEFRQKGIGRYILEQCIEKARELGYEKMQLDTLGRLTDANRRYKELGFYEIAPFRFNPYEDAKYYELKL